MCVLIIFCLDYVHFISTSIKLRYIARDVCYKKFKETLFQLCDTSWEENLTTLFAFCDSLTHVFNFSYSFTTTCRFVYLFHGKKEKYEYAFTSASTAMTFKINNRTGES